MPALTQDRPTPEREGRLVSDPLATDAVIFAGALYVLDADGKAAPATAASARPVRAVALRRASDGAGDEHVDGAVGVFCFDGGTGAGEITRADIGAAAYVVDDQTVTKTPGDCVAGTVFDVDERGVWIRIGG
ncbi:MAG: hypothetical protein Q4G71_03800 [Pseudomonadota bacterium]|nr:hypothetical protein [Pseudomonadota bacterium]